MGTQHHCSGCMPQGAQVEKAVMTGVQTWPALQLAHSLEALFTGAPT